MAANNAKGNVAVNSNKEKSRLLSLDLLKGISILLIILTHVNLTNQQKSDILSPYWIWAAVPIFMVISGYSYTLSIEREKMQMPWEWFSFQNFSRKAWRLLLPFLIAIFVQTLYFVCFKNNLSASAYINETLLGGLGPGGYYNAMLAQLLVLFPVLYFAVEKQKAGLIVICAIVYEVAGKWAGLSDGFYRVCVLRYVTAVTLGILLRQYEAQLKKSVLPWLAMIAGALYLYLVVYTDYSPVISQRWISTSMFMSPYAFGIVWLGLKLEPQLKKISRGWIRIVLYWGKASYHIFLAQMVYFYTPITTYLLNKTNVAISIIADVIICLTAGSLFYALDTRVRSMLKQHKAKTSEHAMGR